jgi:phosphate uptake regulator
MLAGLPARTRELTGGLAAAVTQMWLQAAGCWRTRDGAAQLPLTRSAEHVHGLHASLIAELGKGGMPEPLAIDMMLIARDYERLGAHALNGARRAAVLAGR